MIADFFSKPLQGEKFLILRAHIMKWIPKSELLIQNNDQKSDRIKVDVGKREKNRKVCDYSTCHFFILSISSIQYVICI